MALFKDYYEVLCVPPHASAEQIRSSFRHLALQSHPDKHPTNSGDPNPAGAPAAVAFTEIQEAYEVLSDVARRYLYDLNYAELVAVRQEAAALEEARRRREQQARLEQQQRERERAERELREKEKERAAAVARATAVSLAAAPEPFSMTRTLHGDAGAKAQDADAARPKPSKKQAATAPSPPVEPLSSGSLPSLVKEATPPPPADAASTGTAAPARVYERIVTDSSTKSPPPRGKMRRPTVEPSKWASNQTPPRSVPSIPPVTLPLLPRPKTLSMSFDSALATTETRVPRSSGGGPPAAGLVCGEEEYHKKAIQRTLDVFFSGFGRGSYANDNGAHR